MGEISCGRAGWGSTVTAVAQVDAMVWVPELPHAAGMAKRREKKKRIWGRLIALFKK